MLPEALHKAAQQTQDLCSRPAERPPQDARLSVSSADRQRVVVYWEAEKVLGAVRTTLLVKDGKVIRTWHIEDWLSGLFQMGAFEK